ncbi:MULTISPECIES: bifunctional 3,4-dihydroxy-2-butanone-4-phosphate synthase/GTP cyclohydrolase II [Halomonas]|uniref:3,4-dihydroxy-2-butanone 4-phosphate synthase n=2 Tax=Halomonas TaxID=2745 RepID=A0AAU7KK42_9GAMM|nr:MULTISPECIES: bifunctional 3,4-dihydroxy-2-butanone-4-phosphate synthase/GTP cyclohydrolase II [Halomonas]MBR9772414.1 3,4-dihydroxy-2-butanone-4-phosphate synthase [Gammaproteobacteria bacterium]MBS8267867.1 3,4-dihydroxy-2-butanone-4-phosphate synthase [Halomonas litopenaei]MBY5939716.1 3,4-dihydroxy-2-butanone-4-phosphate synthase [Halomonas sp. DP5N14-9]MBY6109274.1 3,4-dihydroxy-2-butanone-4-phosphate synthase [Halomonas sp. DP1Y21-3]MCJ8284019.1 bifunctional 3,4-dihydroxy-2-butanone-4|tara:strand:+ start:437 stop:1582 length:1146 start_codon:yes stop_codon:yes gene_type:complete
MSQSSSGGLAPIAELVEDIRQGRMVILMDDEDRENEGDIIMAAEKVEAWHINFMAVHARGLICMPMTRERCEQLKLPLMVQDNGSGFGTKFTLSIEAAEGVSTGISAADRARTVQAASARNAKAEDIVQPGHIFPLMAEPGGVLRRAGHTEAACDLAALAGCDPSGVICEIMNDDGSMARRPELERFAETHGIKMGTIADLIHYRIHNEQTVEEVERLPVTTAYGELTAHVFLDRTHKVHHLALVKGSPSPDSVTTVRVHLANEMRDLMCLVKGEDASWRAHQALEEVARAEQGVFVLLDDMRPHQDLNDMLQVFLERRRTARGSESDGAGNYLTIGTGSQILRELGVGRMRLLSSPWKFSALSGFDLEVVDIVSPGDISG